MGGIKEPQNRIVGYREQQVVAFILRYYLEHCRAPTRREVMDGCCINSKGEISRIIRRIERRGGIAPARAKRAIHPRRKPVINGCPT